MKAIVLNLRKTSIDSVGKDSPVYTFSVDVCFIENNLMVDFQEIKFSIGVSAEIIDVTLLNLKTVIGMKINTYAVSKSYTFNPLTDIVWVGL